jgi:molybdate/tungstate transport system substrate-binding protein
MSHVSCNDQLNPPRRIHLIFSDRINLIHITTLLIILTLIIVFSSHSSPDMNINKQVNAQGLSEGVASTRGGGGDVNVLYAGSLISIMETKIGPFFSQMGYNYKGEGHGSSQNANMIIDKQRFPDIFISVGEQPIARLIHNNPSLAEWYLSFASDELVIAYNPKSQFAADFEQAKTGSIPWYDVLAKPGIKFLRSDPLLDPKGCYTVIATKLAGIFYHNSSLSSSVLKGERNPDQLRPEELLLTLLETGEADAIPAYKHEAIERGFPFISLPAQINLGDPTFASYYKQAGCTQLNGSSYLGKPIVFDVTIPKTVRNTDGATQFIKFLLSDQGKKIFQNDGFKLLAVTANGNKTAIPQGIPGLAAAG